MFRGFGLIMMAALALAPTPGMLLARSPAPRGGTISIEPKTAEGTYDASIRPFANAMSAVLTARGFTIFDDARHAASTADLRVRREQVGTSLARVPGQRAVTAVGTGLALPLSTGASDVVPLQRTRLEMHIRRRGEPGDVWAGTAVTVRAATGRNGSDETVAADLARALVQSYPEQPQGVIGVP